MQSLVVQPQTLSLVNPLFHKERHANSQSGVTLCSRKEPITTSLVNLFGEGSLLGTDSMAMIDFFTAHGIHTTKKKQKTKTNKQKKHKINK